MLRRRWPSAACPSQYRPAVVGSAMRDDVAHAHHAVRGVDVESLGGDETGNAAHDYAASVRDRDGLRGAVDELPEPQLQHQQAPEPVAMILPARAMFAPEPSRRPKARRSRDRAAGRPAAGRRPFPRADREAIRPTGTANPCFGRLTIDAGTWRSSSRRRRCLLRPFFSLSDVGTVAANSSSLMIEQRLAGFQRHRHAHLVDLRHDVVDEIRVDVDVEGAIERIRRFARGVRAPEALERIGVAHTQREVARVELGAAIAVEQAVRVLARVRICRMERQMSQRAHALETERQTAGDPAGQRARPTTPSQRRAASSDCSTRCRV